MSRKNKQKKSAAAQERETAGKASTSPNGEARLRQTEPTWLEYWTVRASRWLGSLQIAVLLLTLFAAVLAIGTMVESWYSGKVAQELVYRAWWFTLLLLLLGVNIFFAAAKKWPWKKHQTGFLITHLGLLTMLAGGILTSLSGTDSQMALLDSPKGDPQGEYGYPQTDDKVMLTESSYLAVKHRAKDRELTDNFDFAPGSFAWHADANFEPDYDPMLSALNFLSYPLPRGWQADLDGGARLQVLNYYPHAHEDPFSPAEGDGMPSFPAMRVQLASPQFGRVQAQWLGLYLPDADDPHRSRRSWPIFQMGPAIMELLGVVPSELVEDFQNPPRSSSEMKMGQLTLRLDGRTQRFFVAENLGKTLPLGDGKELTITRYLPNSSARETDFNQTASPSDPMVEFEVLGGGKATKYRIWSRANSRSGEVNEDAAAASRPKSRAMNLQYWYEPPDPSFGGGDQQRGVLHFVQTAAGKLFYRSFHQVGGQLQLERPGEELALNRKGEPIDIWAGMKWRFYLLDYLPNAVYKPRLVPENARPGLERYDLHQAVTCRLTYKNKPQDFWLLFGQTRRVTVGDETFAVEYSRKLKDLDFTLKLLRAEQTVDPGTQAAASYSSFVQLTDDGHSSHSWMPGLLRPLTNILGLTQGGEPIEGEDHWITMNAPLNHRGYKVYQSGYEFRGFDQATDKPVNRSVFTVGRDPGLFLKYAGSTMLALGIVIMFYMKAYFFKPRSRGRTAAATGSEQDEATISAFNPEPTATASS